MIVVVVVVGFGVAGELSSVGCDAVGVGDIGVVGDGGEVVVTVVVVVAGLGFVVVAGSVASGPYSRRYWSGNCF